MSTHHYLDRIHELEKYPDGDFPDALTVLNDHQDAELLHAIHGESLRFLTNGCFLGSEWINGWVIDTGSEWAPCNEFDLIGQLIQVRRNQSQACLRLVESEFCAGSMHACYRRNVAKLARRLERRAHTLGMTYASSAVLVKLRKRDGIKCTWANLPHPLPAWLVGEVQS